MGAMPSQQDWRLTQETSCVSTKSYVLSGVETGLTMS